MCNTVVRLTSYCHALQGKNLPSAADFRNISEKFIIKENSTIFYNLNKFQNADRFSCLK